MSKWDKLITRICNLSKDLRFDELGKVLKSYGYMMNAQKVETVTILSENKDVCQLQYQSTSQSRKYM